MIPRHEQSGLLPVGIHQASWPEFAARFGFSARRRRLLIGLKAALLHLAEAGCASAFIGGSFVTTKAQPGDVDVVWDVTGVDRDQVHPVFLGPGGRAHTIALFGAEFFPSFLIEASTELTFVEFFQQHTEDGRLMGIVQVDLSTL
jgi:hypothetical protein